MWCGVARQRRFNARARARTWTWPACLASYPACQCTTRLMRCDLSGARTGTKQCARAGRIQIGGGGGRVMGRGGGHVQEHGSIRQTQGRWWRRRTDPEVNYCRTMACERRGCMTPSPGRRACTEYEDLPLLRVASPCLRPRGGGASIPPARLPGRGATSARRPRLPQRCRPVVQGPCRVRAMSVCVHMEHGQPRLGRPPGLPQAPRLRGGGRPLGERRQHTGGRGGPGSDDMACCRLRGHCIAGCIGACSLVRNPANRAGRGWRCPAYSV